MNNVTNRTSYTKYTPATLLVNKNYVFTHNKDLPSGLAYEILKFRREYRSSGIANFAEVWLEPTLNQIIKDLINQGYNIVYKIVNGGSFGYGNYLIDVSKDGEFSDVLFVAHYDTVDKDVVTSYGGYNTVTKRYETSTIRDSGYLYKAVNIDHSVLSVDTNSPISKGVGCLGADDGAGLAVLLARLKAGVLGGYCITTGEEKGGIGADEVMSDQQGLAFLKSYSKAIEIDRRGQSEIIYSQGVGDCASKEWTQALCDQINAKSNLTLAPSEFGSYTDVATFAEVIPECVNISAGYINAHSVAEQLDVEYLDELHKALLQVDWDSLKVQRTAGDFGDTLAGYDSYSTYNSYKRPYAMDVLDEDVISLTELEIKVCLKLALDDPDFADYLFTTPIYSTDDLDYYFLDYYGMSFEEALKEGN